MELTISSEIISKVFDKDGNVKHGVLDDMVANVVEEAAKEILSGVQMKIRSGKTRSVWRGHFHDSTKVKKINDTEWQVVNDALSQSGYPYGTVIEFGYLGQKERFVPFIFQGQETELVQYLVDKGWKRTKKEGELESPSGKKAIGVTVRHEGKHPFREGFYASKDKWVDAALKGIIKALDT